MQLKIVQTGDPVLRARGRTLTPQEIVSPGIQQLIALMRETMREAPGVGLAAPQIGVPLQLAVIEDTADVEAMERKPVPFHVIVNPRLTLGPQRVSHFEGCLSVEGFQAIVPRARTVSVEALDHNGSAVTINAEGWYARILQHEIDHLFGALYIDRMHTRTFSSTRNVGRHWAGIPVPDLLSALEIEVEDPGDAPK